MWTFICTLARDVKKCARESICQCQTAGKKFARKISRYGNFKQLSECLDRKWNGYEKSSWGRGKGLEGGWKEGVGMFEGILRVAIYVWTFWIQREVAEMSF